MRGAASLHARALEPSVNERPLTTHGAGHRAREAKPGPSAKALIEIVGPECCSRGDRSGGSEAASRRRPYSRLQPDSDEVRLKADTTYDTSRQLANRLRQGYGGPPKLHAKAEAGSAVETDSRTPHAARRMIPAPDKPAVLACTFPMDGLGQYDFKA